MRFVFYTHSLISDWNHGNAHFLRGIMRELLARGHSVLAMEPEKSWSRENLRLEQGEDALDRFSRDFPELTSRLYGEDCDHEAELSGADVVVVHEWTDPARVAALGRLRRQGHEFTLLFHDTHHRAVSEAASIAAMALADYDGVLAFGDSLKERYLQQGWGRSVFTWHEAADTQLFHPRPDIAPNRDLVWIGNWGDDERSEALRDFLMVPAASLGLSGTVHGVRWPEEARRQLEAAGLSFSGWIANVDVPDAFARHRVTVHVPRGPYVRDLPGIPTIRMFEALACGIPLVSAPWEDTEHLFRKGTDFLMARDGREMTSLLEMLLAEPTAAAELAAAGRETILARHTCRHRVDELFDILRKIGTARVVDALRPMEAAQ